MVFELEKYIKGKKEMGINICFSINLNWTNGRALLKGGLDRCVDVGAGGGWGANFFSFWGLACQRLTASDQLHPACF